MSKPLPLVLDHYDRGARLYPAMIAMFPALVAGSVMVPHFFGKDALALLLSLVAACGLLVLVAHVARDAGKAKESGWFHAWGGRPSVSMLRHRDRRLLGPDKAHHHSFLAAHVPGLCLPSAEQEMADPAGADGAYGRAVNWLLQQTRDQAHFGLLFRRNLEYGFRRNLTALRSVALSLDSVLICGVVTTLLLTDRGVIPERFALPASGAGLTLGVAVLHAALALAILRPAWVARASEDFSRQLLASCDTLGASPVKPAAKKAAAPTRKKAAAPT
ncbi:hypothetical protein [Roseomonas sp. 18066]|uniref:hypothetical protein n=1 Tax=Roseomonas sp. 18066 TaxID=2681412 RepID=UPI00135ACB63|nr:hypothetical protein [Roseomonas sp. 18066]